MGDAKTTTRFRFWLWLIALVGVIVPRRLRRDWRQEWEAELRYRELLLAEWDRLDWRHKLDLLWRSTSAFWDALWLQQLRWEDEMFQDLRYGVRMLSKHPGFTLVTVLTLALGIGANTAIFSVVNAILLRPLNYKDPERLVVVNHYNPKSDSKLSVSASGYAHYKQVSHSFEQMGAATSGPVNLTGPGDAERLQWWRVTHTFLPTLGAAAARGHIFTAEEDQPGPNRVVVLSDGLWQRRFGGDPQLVGKTITLNGEGYTVIGVLPPAFQFGRESGETVDLWTPIAFTPQQLDPGAWRNENLFVIARLKPDVTIGQAQAELDTIASNVRQQYLTGQEANDPGSWGLRASSPHENIVGDIRPSLLILLGAVALVLLIACANVANLLLARVAGRGRELALRAALGASRWRLLRQLLTESVLLAALGGALGLLLAYWGVNLLLLFAEERIPRANEIGIDAQALFFTFGISLLTGVLFGLAPALQTAKGDLHQTLREGGRSSTTRQGMGSLFVVAEVALGLVLLVGAGLLLKSFWLLQQVDPGFRPDHILVMQLSLPASKYREPQQVDAFYQQALQNIQALPGVEAASISTYLPMSGSNQTTSFDIEGRPVASGETAPSGSRWHAGATYFQTMGIPLIKGRYFDDRDVRDAAQVAIIDETMARKLWADEDPLGKHISMSFQRDPNGHPIWREIVGVVGHVKHEGLEGETPAQYYLPLRQLPARGVFLVVRTAAEPTSLTAAVRGEIRAVDSDLPVFRITTMEQMVSDSMARRRFLMVLLGVFALSAVILASVGLYGVMSYTVTQRTNEIGVRMALGAQARDVLRLVIRQGMTLALIGVVAGLAGALLLTRLMKTLLFGVSAADPLTFALIAILLTAVALLACWLPARRATKVDPLMALRHD